MVAWAGAGDLPWGGILHPVRYGGDARVDRHEQDHGVGWGAHDDGGDEHHGIGHRHHAGRPDGHDGPSGPGHEDSGNPFNYEETAV